MKKLLIILLSLPIICFSQAKATSTPTTTPAPKATATPVIVRAWFVLGEKNLGSEEYPILGPDTNGIKLYGMSASGKDGKYICLIGIDEKDILTLLIPPYNSFLCYEKGISEEAIVSTQASTAKISTFDFRKTTLGTVK